MTTALLVSILAVTIVVPDLEAVEAAYGSHLRYRVVERGTVDADLARAWAAPAMRGRRLLVLGPESGEPVFLRFVEAPATPDSAALKTLGWNATEILVEDPDALGERLRDSPFRIVGPPRDLQFNPKVRAMQVLGPAGELLYLTRIPPGGSMFDLGSARSFVDRTFIVVLGGRSMPAMRAFYRDVLGLPVTEARPSRVEVLNDAWGYDGEHQIPLAIAQLPKNFLVELDEYPAAAAPRPARGDELPPGMAIVTFGVRSLDALRVPTLASPSALAGPAALEAAPYHGRRALLLRGGAGELVELVELGDEADSHAGTTAGVPD
jgi:catechol 2,3-dioxygenase-like lactoylglutathione lyase family enzyme